MLTPSRPASRVAALVACCVIALPGAAIADRVARPAGSQSRPQCGDPVPQTVTPPGVSVTLRLSGTKVRRGEPLRLKVTVRNDGLVPIPYSHGGQTHDFWIRDENGLVWLWSQGKVFTDQLEQDMLSPGESRSAQTRWFSECTSDGNGLRTTLPRPGRYVGQALWVSQAGDQDGAWWSNEVEFRITP